MTKPKQPISFNTPDMVKRAAELYKTNSIEDVGIILGCSAFTVKRLLRQGNVKIRPHHEALAISYAKRGLMRTPICETGNWPAELVEKVKLLYTSGMTLKQVGAALSVREAIVSRMLKSVGIRPSVNLDNGKLRGNSHRRKTDAMRMYEHDLIPVTDSEYKERIAAKGIDYTTAYADNIGPKTDDRDKADPVPRWVSRVRSGYSSDSTGNSSLCGFIA